MILNVLGWLAGLPIGSIVSSITDLRKVELSASSQAVREEAETRRTELEAQRDVMVAEAKQVLTATLNSAFRIFLSMPAALIIWQYIVVDKIIAPLFGGHATDDLSQNLWNYVLMVLGYWFLKSVLQGK